MRCFAYVCVRIVVGVWFWTCFSFGAYRMVCGRDRGHPQPTRWMYVQTLVNHCTGTGQGTACASGEHVVGAGIRQDPSDAEGIYPGGPHTDAQRGLYLNLYVL